MKAEITAVKEIMRIALERQGYEKDDIEFLSEMYLGGELRGHSSHGLASFIGFAGQAKPDLAESVTVKETDAFIFIDAKSNLGAIVGKRAADAAIDRARKQVVGTAMIKNMESWLRPGAIAEYIAEQGMLAIVINSGGGTVVVPPGGAEPATGTNPIAYAIPTDDGPLVVDMATSKRAWAQVRLANKYHTKLPPDSYYDKDGNATEDPAAATSVAPFGEYKGFALALLIEIMCGSLVGMEMMKQNQTPNTFGAKMSERGGFILVLDPEQTVGLANFKKNNSEFLGRINKTKPRSGEKIRIPGEQAGRKRTERLEAGTIEIPEELWEELQRL